jgi:hypothetical protein
VAGRRARVHLEIALVVALGVTDVGLDVRGVGNDLVAALALRREVTGMSSTLPARSTPAIGSGFCPQS